MEVCGRQSFGLEHFGAARLGDPRRTRRLVRAADAIMSHPGGSLPEKLKQWSELMGLYRLVQRPEVTHQRVLEPHQQRTLALMAQTPVVLLLHDTTELDYSSHPALSGLGSVGNGRKGGGASQGYLCHNTLAITPDRRVLGLASQILHIRREVPKGESPSDKRQHPQRESRLWLRGAQATGTAPADCLWVDVADRGADTFEFLDYEHRHARHYVIRSARDRKLAGEDHLGADRVYRYLHDYARDLPMLGTRQVQVHANRGRTRRQARTATVSLSAARVSLAVPHFARGECHNQQLELWVMAVREIQPPAGIEPLEWILLSNLPTETLEQARERLDFYECRPVVEELHKAQKSGIDIEHLRFEHADRLEPVIALLSVVAAMLLDLRQQAREPRAEQVLARHCVPLLWVQVLSGWRYKQVREDLSLREFYMALGKLGGHLGRKCDRFPGWRKLWLGWSELQMMVRGALAIQRQRCV